MGVIKRGILGGFSGKVANVVGSSWKGIAVIRALPLSVNNPRTAGQVKQRTAFSEVSKFASSILTQWVKPLWDRTAQQMSGYNAFIQKNVDFVKAQGELQVPDLIMSQGKLGLTSILNSSEYAGNMVNIDFDPTPVGSFQMDTDKAYALVVSEEGEVFGYSQGVVERKVGTINVSLLREPAGGTVVYAILAFSRTDGTIVGDSSLKQFFA